MADGRGLPSPEDVRPVVGAVAAQVQALSQDDLHAEHVCRVQFDRRPADEGQTRAGAGAGPAAPPGTVTVPALSAGGSRQEAEHGAAAPLEPWRYRCIRSRFTDTLTEHRDYA